MSSARLRLVSDAQQNAQTAADAIRAAIAEPAKAGQRSTVRLLLSRPRRGVWMVTWANLPGLLYDSRNMTYSHALLPGWCYTNAEMKTEMLDDLERFASIGELPKQATR